MMSSALNGFEKPLVKPDAFRYPDSVDVTRLLELIAGSGLSDDDYALVAESIRVLVLRAEAGTELAEVILAHECYLPDAAMTAVGRFYLPADAAAVA